MNSKKILIGAFILMVLAQLYVPAQMIWDREEILEYGTEFYFRTAPIDPSDPFRGKYIVLRYTDNYLKMDGHRWENGEAVFVCLARDEEGFAIPESLWRERPECSDFLATSISYVVGDSTEQEVYLHYPFDRYYMEESKAYDAEQEYREAQRDAGKVAYAVVRIQEGQAVLNDVMIDGKSIREIVLE